MLSGSSTSNSNAVKRWCPPWAASLLAILLGGPFAAHGASAGELVPDWTQVGAIFRERCIMCHSEAAAERSLRLDTYAGAIAGSVNGPVLIPGDPASSELIRRLNGSSRPRMPFLSRPLGPEAIDLIEHWIAAGLPEHLAGKPDSGPE